MPLYHSDSTAQDRRARAERAGRDTWGKAVKWLPAPSAAGSADAESLATAFSLPVLVDAVADKANDAENDQRFHSSSVGSGFNRLQLPQRRQSGLQGAAPLLLLLNG